MYLFRMKGQVKTRMEELIAQETAARQKASTVAKETSTTPTSGKSSTVASTLKTSTLGGSSFKGSATPSGVTGGRVEKPHQSVEAKADLLFEVDTGEGVWSLCLICVCVMCVCVCVCSMSTILIASDQNHLQVVYILPFLTITLMPYCLIIINGLVLSRMFHVA